MVGSHHDGGLDDLDARSLLSWVLQESGRSYNGGFDLATKMPGRLLKK